MKNGKNRRRRWHEKQQNRHLRKLVLTTIAILVAILCVALFYDGTHMPVVHKSNGTKEIVQVFDASGKPIVDKVTEDKILAGRYEIIWVL
ncbi:MAG TPA: hypothetical protein VJH94_05055 [Candidatus Paceibacterota bacterium]